MVGGLGLGELAEVPGGNAGVIDIRNWKGPVETAQWENALYDWPPRILEQNETYVCARAHIHTYTYACVHMHTMPGNIRWASDEVAWITTQQYSMGAWPCTGVAFDRIYFLFLGHPGDGMLRTEIG